MKYSGALEAAQRVTAQQLVDRIISLPVDELLDVWRPGIKQTTITEPHVFITTGGSVYVTGRTAGRCDRFRSFFLYSIDGEPTVFGSFRLGRVCTEQQRIER